MTFKVDADDFSGGGSGVSFLFESGGSALAALPLLLFSGGSIFLSAGGVAAPLERRDLLPSLGSARTGEWAAADDVSFLLSSESEEEDEDDDDEATTNFRFFGVLDDTE